MSEAAPVLWYPCHQAHLLAATAAAEVAENSAALAAARCTTDSGNSASRATFSPKDDWATPGVSLYRNVILQGPRVQNSSDGV